MVGYIGKEPTVGNFIKLDAISTSSTNTYNLANGGVAYSPENSRVCLVSLNGVIQSPDTAYTISGSQITFIPSSGTLTSDDTIDFIMVYGDVLSIGTPSDNTVSASKLTTDSVITAKVQNDAITTDKINLVSTSSTPSLEAKGDGGSQDGYIQLNCSQNSHGIKLKSPPHSANASYVLTFPNNDGNANQVLTTDGSGVLSFADAGGGSLVKLHSVTTTDTTTTNIDFTSTYINSTYDNYLMMIDTTCVTDGAILRVLMSESGVFQTGSTYYGVGGTNEGGTNYNTNTQAYAQLDFNGNGSNVAGEGMYVMANFFGLRNSSRHSGFVFEKCSDEGNHGWNTGSGGVTSVVDNDGIRLVYDSGNFGSGTKVTLYGYEK